MSTADFESFFYIYLMEDPKSWPPCTFMLTKKHLIEKHESLSVHATFTCTGLNQL